MKPLAASNKEVRPPFASNDSVGEFLFCLGIGRRTENDGGLTALFGEVRVFKVASSLMSHL